MSQPHEVGRALARPAGWSRDGTRARGAIRLPRPDFLTAHLRTFASRAVGLISSGIAPGCPSLGSRDTAKKYDAQEKSYKTYLTANRTYRTFFSSKGTQDGFNLISLDSWKPRRPSCEPQRNRPQDAKSFGRRPTEAEGSRAPREFDAEFYAVFLSKNSKGSSTQRDATVRLHPSEATEERDDEHTAYQ